MTTENNNCVSLVEYSETVQELEKVRWMLKVLMVNPKNQPNRIDILDYFEKKPLTINLLQAGG